MADQAASSYDLDPQTLAWNYRERRRTYYSRFPSFWGTLAGEKREEYAIYGALDLTRAHAQALRTASARLYHLLTRLARLLQTSGEQTLIDLGLPPATVPYAQIMLPEAPALMCGRFEFVMTASGPKLLELNAETPTFVYELFHVNARVCNDFGLIDPNEGCQAQLAQAIQASISSGLQWIGIQNTQDASIVFSAPGTYLEERSTVEFYRSILEAQEHVPYRVSFQALETLQITSEYLSSADGTRIDVLYKLYPTEYLVDDEAADGTPIGLALMDLVRQRRLAVLNPPVAFLLQNKALVALLWTLHLAHSPLFSTEEHYWINRYLLPTYLDPSEAQSLPQQVIKPVYGREGVSITICSGQKILEQSEEHDYAQQVKIYQQYAPLPVTTILTEEGFTSVNLVHNCFITAGTPSAVGVRASRKLIFDDASYFLPVCYPPEEVNAEASGAQAQDKQS